MSAATRPTSEAAAGTTSGLADAFYGHLHPDRAESSILYRNLGGNRFRDVSRSTGLVDRSWSGDATPFDANGDGWPDLYVLSMQGANHLWLNEGGKRFRDATSRFFPATPWGAMGVKVFDYNGDGRLDLFVTDMHSDMHTNLEPGDVAAEERKSDTAAMDAKFFPTGKGGLDLRQRAVREPGRNDSRRSPTPRESRTTGPGGRAWTISTPTDGTTSSSPPA